MDTQLTLSLPEASRLLALGFGRPVRATEVAPAAGGMITSVLRLRFDVPPGRAIVKLSRDVPSFEGEARTLRFLREKTELRVPEPLFLVNDATQFPMSALGLEELPGVPLGAVRLSTEDRAHLDEQMAEQLLKLHQHTRKTFGFPLEEGVPRWIYVFRPRLVDMVDECRGKTDGLTIQVSDRLLDGMEDLFGHRPGPARLIHGDLWANNVMVMTDDAGRIKLSGFIDSSAHYADAEYELAYLECFQTVGPRFFELYARVFPLDEGYPIRRAIYNLHTMLIHIWLFGDAHYHQRAAALAETLNDALRLGV